MIKDCTVHAGWLIDGSGDQARPGCLIDIREGKIESIRPADGTVLADTDGDDFTSCTVLPGMIDSHVHLFMSGTDNRKIRDAQLDAPFATIQPVIESHIKAHLSHGVMAVRDGGDRHGHTLHYKHACHDPLKYPLIVHTAGSAWHAQNRYGRLIGRPPEARESLAHAVFGDTEVKDHLKVVNSGLNSLVSFGRQTAPQFDAGDLKAGIAASNRRNWPVMVHANGVLPVRDAIDAGCRSIEHGFFMGEENLKRLADAAVFWVPTAYTMQAFAAHFNNGDTASSVPRKNLDHQLNQIAAARRLGVRIALGTDAGSLGVHHGKSLMEELTLLMQAGYPVEEAICCATANGAKLLGIGDLGELIPGAAASFVAVPGPPSRLPESLRSIRKIFINGAPYAPFDLK